MANQSVASGILTDYNGNPFLPRTAFSQVFDDNTGKSMKDLLNLTENRLLFWKDDKLNPGGHYINDTKVAINSTAAPSYNLYVNGTTYLNGNTTIKGTLSVSSNTSLNGTLSIAGNTTINGVLTANKGINISGGHVYLTGAASTSTANTTQLIFGTSAANHIAISSNGGTSPKALVLNPTSASTTDQIVLYLEEKPSWFPLGISAREESIFGDISVQDEIDIISANDDEDIITNIKQTDTCLTITPGGTSTTPLYIDGATEFAGQIEGNDGLLVYGQAVITDDTGNVWITGSKIAAGAADSSSYLEFVQSSHNITLCSENSMFIEADNGTLNLFGSKGLVLDDVGSMYGTQEEMDAIESPVEGQIFYLLV